MRGRNDVELFVPTLERAKAAGVELAGYTASDTLMLAAIVVAARTHDADTRVMKSMFETYVPGELRMRPRLFGLEAKIEATTTPGQRFPPKVLRCEDLKPVRVGGAYRSAETEKAPDFHGFGFGDALEQATLALERFFLGADAEGFDIAAYAWPLLWLENAQIDREAVVWIDCAGALVLFEGVPVERVP